MLKFENESIKLDLDVICYEFPDGGTTDSNDGNWLVLRATYEEDGKIIKDSNSCLMTYELKDLTAGLKVMGAGLRDTYESSFTEPYFLLNAWTKPEGGFGMEVSFTLPNTMESMDVAELEVSMSQEQLKTMVDELDRYCAKFPEK